MFFFFTFCAKKDSWQTSTETANGHVFLDEKALFFQKENLSSNGLTHLVAKWYFRLFAGGDRHY